LDMRWGKWKWGRFYFEYCHQRITRFHTSVTNTVSLLIEMVFR
jgi:hypothetical protein